MRGSDADAAIYYLARDDRRRRGPRVHRPADDRVRLRGRRQRGPQALEVAVAAARAVEFVGLPECRINLSQAVAYLALAPKSNASATVPSSAALADVRERGTLRPPNAAARRQLRRRGQARPRPGLPVSARLPEAAGSSSSTCRTSCWARSTTSPATASRADAANAAGAIRCACRWAIRPAPSPEKGRRRCGSAHGHLAASSARALA